MKRIILLALIAASFVSQATVVLKIGANGYVIVGGQNLPRNGSVNTMYSYGTSDTTLTITGFNYSSGAHSYSYYLDGDNSNAAFTSAAQLIAWDKANIQPVACSATATSTLQTTGNATLAAIKTADSANVIYSYAILGGTSYIPSVNDAVNTSNGYLSTIATNTADGVTPYRLLSAATTNATNISAVPSTMYYILATNSNAAARFVKIYDKATAPNPVTDVPIITYRLAPLTGILNLPIPKGITFSLGISFLITGAIGDTDATAVSLNDVALNIGYK